MKFTTKDLGEVSGTQLLVFGGVYSNLEALIALKAEADLLGLSPNNIICTGDIVAYCADPEACLQLIRDWGIHCIAGNVEIQLRERQEDCGCNFEENTRCDIFSRHWYPYAQKQVSESSLEWMENLPHHLLFNFGGKSFRVVHGSVFGVSDYVFHSTSNTVIGSNFLNSKTDVILAGHCGLPFSTRSLLNGESIKSRLWWNAGVIGMPANDGDKKVWYSTVQKIGNPAFGVQRTLLGESQNLLFKHHALSYDAKKAQEKMIKFQLPAEYAKTLTSGLWDNCEILPEEETKAQGLALQLPDILI